MSLSSRLPTRSIRPLHGAALAVALLLPAAAHARNLMSADGPGGTYELLRKAYTTELPDCGHMVPHITEEADSELGKNVFVFHAHVKEDDDRCGGKDRQRTEIRAAAPDITANNGETLYYRWKFKLPTGFKGTPSFTHIFQIKSDLGAPIMTLTPRVSTFEITGRASGSSGKTELAKFIGVWVVVNLKVLFSDSGRVELNIRRASDGMVLYSYAGAADMWDAGASAHDSKFGIYRSLNYPEMMRDEQVRFADFCASKTSASECEDGATPPAVDAGAVDGDAGAGEGGAGGASGTGGSSGTGGNDASGGSSGTGGNPASGGASGSGGAAGTGGQGGSKPAGSGGSGGSSRPAEPGSGESEPSGCSCSLGGSTAGVGGAGWLILLAAVFAVARRRHRGRR
jgi:MYXO-CTERM domain-containing protein